MKVLLVHPQFPTTFWGLQYGLRLIGKGTLFPPLGLLTVAALLPTTWDLELLDLNLTPLTRDRLEAADIILCGGMLIQADSMNDVVRLAHAVGKRVILGGPAPTTAPDLFPDADILFQGEAEGRGAALLAAITDPASSPRLLPPGPIHPDMTTVPLPRFDLLGPGRYGAMSIQFSRGCPYHCEFCDIVEIFGNTPRVKSPAQILAELDALYTGGHRGTLFLVDDNFIGNRPAVLRLLPELLQWQQSHGFPFTLMTEASVTLAADQPLMEQMVATGFTAVFVGIETPSEVALKSANKLQNLRMDLTEVVQRLTRAGLEVMGGFIVGFDSDDPGIFALQRNFILGQPIPLAMVGLLSALPGTQLWQRMAREGRLRHRSSGDQFDRPNFDPSMDERSLLKGYRWLLAEIFSAEAYYARCEQFLALVGHQLPRFSWSWIDVRMFLQVVLRVGILGAHRRHFWRLLAHATKGGTRAVHWAMAHALHGEHLIRYTRDHVLPRLDETIRALQPDPAPAPA